MKDSDIYFKPKEIAYHCSNCSATVNPKNEYCEYCGEKHGLDKYKEERGVRVMVVLPDNKKIYLKNILSISANIQPEYIDVTTLDCTCVRKVRNNVNRTVSFDFATTLKSLKSLYEINKHRNFDTYLEVVDLDVVYKFKTDYVSDLGMAIINPNELCRNEVEFGLNGGFEVLNDTRAIDLVENGLRCPNCSSLITSKLHICDYCGGWVEVKER